MEVRNGTEAYIIFGSVIRTVGSVVNIYKFIDSTTANSQDEAYGIGARAIRKVFPEHSRFRSHDIVVVRLDDIGWIDRLNVDNLKEWSEQ